MNTSELLTRTWDFLGGNTTFYTQAELIVNGLNPAMRLLCLLQPSLLTRRVPIPFQATSLYYDLRTDQPMVSGTVTDISSPIASFTPTTGLVDIQASFASNLVGMRVRHVSSDAVGIITAVPNVETLRFTGGLTGGRAVAVGDAYRVEFSTADCWRLERVLLGGMIGDNPVKSNNQLRPLLKTTLAGIGGRRRWYMDRGTPRYWWMHGLSLLCVHPRPEQDEFLTLVYPAMPTALTVSDLNAEPNIAAVHHDILPPVAAALCLGKEGGYECQRAMAWLEERLGAEPFAKLRRALRAAGLRPAPTETPAEVA